MEETRERINKYLMVFLFGGFLGWIIELLYRSIINQQIVNPGFLSGPFLPLYGFGLVLLTIILNQKKLHWFIKIFIFTIIATLMELLSGWFFEIFFRLRLWDYSKEWANFNGWICPRFFLYWLVASLLYFLFIHEALTKKIYHNHVSRPHLFFTYLFILIIFIDITHAFYSAEKIEDTWIIKHKKTFPVLTDYKIFKPNNATDFVNSLIQSVENYTNYKLPDKILKK